MKYAAVFAGAALAQFAQGAIHRDQHGGIHAHHRHHAKKDVVTEVDYVTVWETKYAAETPETSSTSSVSTSSSSSTSMSASSSPVYQAEAKHFGHQSYSHASSSAEPIASSSSSTPVTYSSPETPTIYSTSEAPTTYSSSEAPSTTSSSETPDTFSSSEAPSATSSSEIPATYSSSATPLDYSSSITSSSATTEPTGITKSSLTPNGKKAGLSGYIGISDTDAFDTLAPYISWYSDYTPIPPQVEGLVSIPMLWGADGSPCGSDMTSRLADFQSLATTPDIMFGFYEPDCPCTMSSDMSVSDAATQWDALIAPLAAQGTILGSPSMCKQKDEDFLTPFNSSITTTWDVTSIHINKPDLAGVQEDVEYYVQTYGKPVWVSEFACVYDQDNFTPCSDQGVIDSFINATVGYLEKNKNVVAYGASNGEGLGDVWPLTKKSADGKTTVLSDTGITYMNAIKGL